MSGGGLEAVLAAHAVSAKTPSDTACRCDRRWQKDVAYRAHVAAAIHAYLTSQPVVEVVAEALAAHGGGTVTESDRGDARRALTAAASTPPA